MNNGNWIACSPVSHAVELIAIWHICSHTTRDKGLNNVASVEKHSSSPPAVQSRYKLVFTADVAIAAARTVARNSIRDRCRGATRIAISMRHNQRTSVPDV